jgi:hypothetical protein
MTDSLIKGTAVLKKDFPEYIFIPGDENTVYVSIDDLMAEYDSDIKVGVYKLQETGCVKKTFKFEKD